MVIHAVPCSKNNNYCQLLLLQTLHFAYMYLQLLFHLQLLIVKLHSKTSARFIKHLKPKVFINSIQIAWNLQKS